MQTSEEFQQLTPRFTDPAQTDYEAIRPIFLFGESVAERSRQTGIPRRTLGDKAQRFLEEGMWGLVKQYVRNPRESLDPYPEAIAAHILYLKHLYPPIHYREIVRILERTQGYKTNHHSVKRFLERHALPSQLTLPLDVPAAPRTPEEAYQTRLTIVRLYFQGWNKKSIAGLLHFSHSQVGRIIATFEREGFAGLEDKRTRPATHPANQLTLPFLKEVLDLQKEYPRAGRFRVHGLLSQQKGEQTPSEATVARAMALNRDFHDAPPPWVSERWTPDDQADEPKHLPYRPQHRQQLWFMDIRYLVQLDGEWIYSLCILEGYSRKILAGMASEYQDLLAVLQILKAALGEYGCPEAIVTDNGQVFQAHDYRQILAALEIEPKPIESGKPWQNIIEPNFKVQLRLADHHFEQATSFEEIQQRHAQFIQTFNATPHWAHQARTDGRHTPEAVLDWVRGRLVEPELLHQLFRQVQWVRTVNRFGFVSIQRFYLYAERGLARQRVAIWLYQGHLQIEHQQQLLAQYHYESGRQRQQLRTVSQPTLYQTPFASPQLELLELDDEQWQKIRPRPSYARRKRLLPQVEQLSWRLALWLIAYPLLGGWRA
jgi:transposase InsO family protein